MLHAAKFRIYPTAAQETFLWAQWGAVRKCWNMALFLKKHYYRTRGVSLDLIHEIKPLIARAKKSKKYAWLREYDSMALQESVRNLNKSYRAFFEGKAGFPHYKSRRGPRQAITAPTSPSVLTTCACRRWSRSRPEFIARSSAR